MKHTGDIHPPEVEYDLDERDEEQAAAGDTGLRAEAPRERVSVPATMALPAPEPAPPSFEDEARAQMRRSPLATLAAAFALGFVLVKLFR
jgi:hypothetical protein